MKMLIEVDTKNVESLQEVIDFCEGHLKFGRTSAKIVNPIGVEDTKEVKPKSTTTKEKKVAVEPLNEPKIEKVSITLTELKDLAQNKAQTVDRKRVKDIISQFAEKLNEVEEKDFESLYEKLKAL